MVNFTSRFSFIYKENSDKQSKEKELYCTQNKKYIENFFDNTDSTTSVIKGITAIVGNNREGKSTVLDLIMDMSKLDTTNFLIVMLKDNNEIIINTSFIKLKIIGLQEYIVNVSDVLDAIENFNCIYHSSMVERKYIEENEKEYIKDRFLIKVKSIM